MNRDEIKTDIETEKLYLEDCETTVKVVREHLAALEAQLAEAEKPELRHGDYGHRDGTLFVYIDNRVSQDTAYYADGTFCTSFTENEHDHKLVIFGNVYAAEQEAAK